jgi:NAD(P)H-nitrite reductase large subunit
VIYKLKVVTSFFCQVQLIFFPLDLFIALCSLQYFQPPSPSSADPNCQRAATRIMEDYSPRQIRCKIIVIGAGIGGLTAAIAARKAGHEVHVSHKL